MIELTRELFERYLRATGWRSKYYASGATYWERGGLSVLSGRDFAKFMGDMQAALGSGDDIRFRLGLCAAAEMVEIEIEELRNGSFHGGYVARRDRFLRAAGIEPAAWEEAR